MGQNTGILKASKNVQNKAIVVALVDVYLTFKRVLSLFANHELITNNYQNLNSGKRLMNGLNSSLALVGSDGPSSEI